MDTHKKMRVHLSALVDDELSAADLELALAALHTPDGQQTWDLYYRIGDELRAQATAPLSDGFGARLAARLDGESLPLRRQAGRTMDGTAGRKSAARASTAARRGAAVNGASTAAAARIEAAEPERDDDLPVDGKAVVLPKPAIASVS